jgi:hypothetical protein
VAIHAFFLTLDCFARARNDGESTFNPRTHTRGLFDPWVARGSRNREYIVCDIVIAHAMYLCLE